MSLTQIPKWAPGGRCRELLPSCSSRFCLGEHHLLRSLTWGWHVPPPSGEVTQSRLITICHPLPSHENGTFEVLSLDHYKILGRGRGALNSAGF